MREEVLSSPQIWLCTMCYRCYSRCPQQVNFTDIMRALRHMAVRDGYVPAEMLAKEDEADKKAQTLRRELVKSGVGGKKSGTVATATKKQVAKKPLKKSGKK
jgi:heterodisulfide reductase subunit C